MKCFTDVALRYVVYTIGYKNDLCQIAYNSSSFQQFLSSERLLHFQAVTYISCEMTVVTNNH